MIRSLQESRFKIIEAIVCNHFCVTPDELIPVRKNEEHTNSRKAIFYFSVKYLECTYRWLQEKYGLKSHACVPRLIERLEVTMNSQSNIYQEIINLDYEIRKKINPPSETISKMPESIQRMDKVA